MWLFIIKFIFGLFLIIKGADFLTDGASSIARKYRVSTLLIGLTIVSFGTSLPELVVSSVSAMKGSSDMAMGNVIGSNMFNTLAIVGVTALFCPIVCKRDLLLRDIPVNVVVTCTLFVMVYYCCGIGTLTRMEGATLLIIFAIYLGFTIYISLKSAKHTDENISGKMMPMWKAILWIVMGITRKTIGKYICELLEKVDCEYQYTLGYYQLYMWWKDPKSKINYNSLNSTLQVLGANMRFRGPHQWEMILSINEYFKPVHNAYIIDNMMIHLYGAAHSKLLDQMKVQNPLEPEAGLPNAQEAPAEE